MARMANGTAFDIELPDLPNNPFSQTKAAFQTGYVFELMDTRNPIVPIDAHVFVLAPRVYTLTEPFQSTLTPSEHDVVIEETNGIIVREIVLEGTFGLKERSPAFNVLGSNQGKAGGTEHFTKLRDLFRKYSDLKKSPQDAAYTKLIWHSLKDDDHFYVVPRSFETPRDQRSGRMHFDYRITMAAIGTADGKSITAVDDGFTFGDALRAVNEAINDVGSFVQEVNALNGQIKRKIGNINAIMLNVASVMTGVSNAISNTSDLLVNYPRQTVASVSEQVSAAADQLGDSVKGFGKRDQELRESEVALRGISMAFDRMLAIPTLFVTEPTAKTAVSRSYLGEKALTAQDLADNTGGASLGSAQRIQYGTAANAGIDLGEQRGMSTVSIDATATLESLARKYSTTAEAIILVNDLRPPYISTSGIPGTIRPGDSIIIPSGTGTTDDDSRAPNASYLTAEEAMYGVDLSIDLNELRTSGKLEILVDTVHGSIDAARAGGIKNVVQGVTIIMVTEKGANQYVPDVGRMRTIGSRGNAENILLAALNTRRAILDDPRISGIEQMKIVVDADVLKMEVTPIVAGFRDGVTFALPFGRTSGG